MFHFTPSSRSRGYNSYLPRGSYLPASFDIDDAPSPAYLPEDLAYPPLSHSFLPPRVDAETRYRRALYELEAAEQEYQAQVSFERARQAAAIRQRAAAEAARREREITSFAQIERARALQEQEGLAQRQRAFRSRGAFNRGHCGRYAPMCAIYGDAESGSVPQCSATRPQAGNLTLTMGDLLGVLAGLHPEGQRASPAERPTPPSRPQPDTETSAINDLLGLFAGAHPERQRASPPERPTPRTRPQADTETSLGDLLGLFAGVHHPEGQRAGPSQRPTSPTSSQPNHRAESQTQSQSPEHENAEVNLSKILDFFHGIAAEARRAAGGEQSTHEQTLPSQREATPVEGKGKGKAKAEPVPEPTLFETLFRERVNGGLEQELRDLEHAIKLSLQDRDTADVKKAQSSKGSQSSPGASSSEVNVEVASSSGRAASPTRNGTSPSVSAAAPEPVSPLTSIRAVRTQFSALESAFKFPSTLDFDHSELAVTSNNAPVRSYEYALNGLLERLDAIESDGDEEVRDVRREVVREVEKALEEVERKIKEQAPQAPVPEDTKEEASHVESEDASASGSQTVLPGVVHVTEAANPTAADVAPVASEADADIDVAISAEYQSGSPANTPSGEVVAERDSATDTALADGDVDEEAVPASEDASDSIATITPAPVAAAVPVPSSNSSSSSKSASTPGAGAESFLTSLSHDQFTFPPRPAFSQSSTNSAVSHDDDAVVVDNSSEGGSVRSVDDEWTTEF